MAEEMNLQQNEEKDEQKLDRWHVLYADDDTMLTIDEMCRGSAVE